MKLTVEMSLYPLHEQYIPVIQDFIDSAREQGELDIVTNAMSTQVSGDYQQVFELVQQGLRDSYERHGKQVLVCKFIPWELDLSQ